MKKFYWVVLSMVLFSLFQNCSKVVNSEQQFSFASTGVPTCEKWEANESIKPFESWRMSDPVYSQNMSSPSVADLDKDGVPEVVFSSFKGGSYTDAGGLSVISGRDGKIKYRKDQWLNAFQNEGSTDDLRPYSTSQPLLIDLDRDGLGEIVFLAVRKAQGGTGAIKGYYLMAADYKLNHRWHFPVDVVDRLGASAADLFQRGESLVIYGRYVLKEEKAIDGRFAVKLVIDMKKLQSSINPSNSFAYSTSEVIGAPMDIITGQGVFYSDGRLKFQFCRDGNVQLSGDKAGSCVNADQTLVGYSAAADLIPENPGAEIVVTGNGFLHIFSGKTGVLLGPDSKFRNLVEHNQTTKCTRKDASGNTYSYVGGGQASIGDFSGKGEPQIAIATGRSLTIFNRRGEVVAGSTTTDCSSVSTGITSFDFNGDGKPEIIYGDEQYLRIFELNERGLQVVWQTANPSGTLVEYPIVADVDGNKTADLLVVANNYACPTVVDPNGKMIGASGVCASMSVNEQLVAAGITGVRLFKPIGANQWMPSRSIWNQGSYFPSNVGYSRTGQFSDNLLPSMSTKYVDSFGGIFKRNIQGNFEMRCQ